MTEAPVLKATMELLLKEPRVDAMRINDNHTKGKPDIIACVNGWFVGLEMKRPGGEASMHQLKRIKKIKDAGGFADVFDNVEDVKTFIRMVKACVR